jgi:hypothetical protein
MHISLGRLLIKAVSPDRIGEPYDIFNPVCYTYFPKRKLKRKKKKTRKEKKKSQQTKSGKSKTGGPIKQTSAIYSC